MIRGDLARAHQILGGINFCRNILIFICYMFSLKISVHIVSMRGYTKKLMEEKEKTTRLHTRGGPDGPEVRIISVCEARMVVDCNHPGSRFETP